MGNEKSFVIKKSPSILETPSDFIRPKSHGNPFSNISFNDLSAANNTISVLRQFRWKQGIGNHVTCKGFVTGSVVGQGESPPNSSIEVLTPSTPKCALIWKLRHCRYS